MKVVILDMYPCETDDPCNKCKSCGTWRKMYREAWGKKIKRQIDMGDTMYMYMTFCHYMKGAHKLIHRNVYTRHYMTWECRSCHFQLKVYLQMQLNYSTNRFMQSLFDVQITLELQQQKPQNKIIRCSWHTSWQLCSQYTISH